MFSILLCEFTFVLILFFCQDFSIYYKIKLNFHLFYFLKNISRKPFDFFKRKNDLILNRVYSYNLKLYFFSKKDIYIYIDNIHKLATKIYFDFFIFCFFWLYVYTCIILFKSLKNVYIYNKIVLTKYLFLMLSLLLLSKKQNYIQCDLFFWYI